MELRSRARLVPVGSLMAVCALVAAAFLSPLNLQTQVSAEQPDVPGIQRAMNAAQAVVVATARSVNSSWQENEFGDRIIQSTILLEVSETLKGRPEKARWLRVEGGTVDGLTLEVSGEPEVRVGERAVFMLDQVRQNLDRPHPVHDAVLPLDEKDFVRGTALNLDDLRRHARGQGR